MTVIFAILALLGVSAVVGAITGTEGLTTLTNQISPYITIAIFLIILYIISKTLRRK